jgi:phosphatidylglycerol:prolipoprotein diacylglycerol transferase
LHVLDVFALVTPPGLMLGRLANFINGELLGRIASNPGEPAPWWAVKFPQEIAGGYSVPLDERRAGELEALIGEFRLLGEATNGAAEERVIDAIQHGGREWAARIEPYLAARHPSQLYQAFAEGVVLGGVLWWFARKPRRPGQVGGAFLITYGVLRILTEVWRLPDQHLAVQRVVGLTRGQWLSVLMIVCAVVGLVIVERRGKAPMGGWMRRRGEPAPGGGT